MRKLITLYMIIVLNLMLYGPFVFAAIDDYAVSIDNVSGVPGAAVTAHVRLTQAGSDICGGAEFNILFNPDALQVDSVEAGSLRTWGMFQHVVLNGNTVRILMVGAEEILNTTGEIALINFSIKSSASLGTSNLTFTKAVLNLNSIDLDFPSSNITNGTAAVVEQTSPPAITGWLPAEDEIMVNINEGAAIQFAITEVQDDGPQEELSFAWEIDDTPVPGQSGQTFDAAATVANLTVGGDYALKVTVTDIDGLSASHTWILKIRTSAAENHPPIAVNDTARVAAGDSVLINVLANDSDVDGDILVVDHIAIQPAKGDVTIAGNAKSVTYTADAGFTGTDTFDYVVADGKSGFDQAAVTIQEKSQASPWTIDADTDQPFFYPIYGTAKRGLQHLQEGDWIGVFDAKGICYGAGQYRVNPVAPEGHEYALSVYAVSGGSSFGTQDNKKLYFKFYIVSTNEELAAVDSGLVPRYYPTIPEDGGYQGDPVRIDLSAAVEQGMALKRGWNLISFTIQPESTRLEEAFNSILTGDNNYLEYVSDHKDFWDKGITGGQARGSLTDVDAYHSYYLKISNDAPEAGVTLTIVGVRVQPNHEFKLVRGWNNLSYLLDISKYAIREGPTAENPQPTYALTGIFKDLKEDIIWMKGATDENNNNWCAGDVSFLKLGPGRGLFLKMHETLPDDPNAAGAISFRYSEQ